MSSGLMGMDKYFVSEGVQGLGNAAGLQTQRENAKTQLEAAHDASVKSTTATMAGTGGMAGWAIGAEIGSVGGPWGAAIGAGIGALAGWLMSEFG